MAYYRFVLFCLLCIEPTAVFAADAHLKPYPLVSWSNITCRAKGRFQDKEYCDSAVMDRIVSDGKSAIPVLISQITDVRRIKEPVYDYWPQIRAGELAHFILQNLFVDETWQHRTMPDLFPDRQDCKKSDPSWVCWEDFRKQHSLKEIQARWMEFWRANESRIYWDPNSRCFRLADVKTKP
jgi:hypothetical protein